MEPNIHSRGADSPPAKWTPPEVKKPGSPKDEAAKVGEKVLSDQASSATPSLKIGRNRGHSSDSEKSSPKRTDSNESSPRQVSPEILGKDAKIASLRDHINILSKQSNQLRPTVNEQAREGIKNSPEQTMYAHLNEQLQEAQKNFQALRNTSKKENSVEQEMRQIIGKYVDSDYSREKTLNNGKDSMQSVLQKAKSPNFPEKKDLFRKIGLHFTNLSRDDIEHTVTEKSGRIDLGGKSQHREEAMNSIKDTYETKFFGAHILPSIFASFDKSGLKTQGEKDQLKLDFIEFMNSRHGLQLSNDLSQYPKVS